MKWDEVFADGTFAPAKKGTSQLEKRSAGREQKLWQRQMVKAYRSGLSFLPRRLTNRKLIEQTLDTIRVPRIGACRPRIKIKRLIYDRNADYTSLRFQLKEERGID